MLLGIWYVVVGVLLMLVTLVGTRFRHLPITTAMVYVAVGVALGAATLLRPDLFVHAHLLELVTEAAVIVSLFVTGMNARLPVRDRRWGTPLRLAFGAMAVTVGLTAFVGTFVFGLSAGAAVLLGAILAPTDPVLAAEVQVHDPDDRDPLRFGLSGEAGLNDGAAFPFLMLGLGLLGLHELGANGWKWVAVDVLWAIPGGLAVGWIVTTLAARLVLWLRTRHGKALGYDDLFTLGLIALSYGAALLLKTYGFLAVFAAGLALRRLERLHTGDETVESLMLDIRRVGSARAARSERMGPAWMLYFGRTISGSFERIGEFGILLVVGALAWHHGVPWQALLFVPLLLFVVRPLSVALGLIGSSETRPRRLLMAWFGLRGIGSVYYLAYALVHGFEGPEAELVVGLVLTTIVASVVLHGVSVTPLMAWYDRHLEDEEAAHDARDGESPHAPHTPDGDDHSKEKAGPEVETLLLPSQ